MGCCQRDFFDEEDNLLVKKFDLRCYKKDKAIILKEIRNSEAKEKEELMIHGLILFCKKVTTRKKDNKRANFGSTFRGK